MGSKQINEIVEYGLDNISPSEMVEIKLKDLMLLFNTMAEFNRFFHNSDHFNSTEDLEKFLGNVHSGAYSIIHKLYYDTLLNYLPDHIESQLGESGDPFEYPHKPFYFDVKN